MCVLTNRNAKPVLKTFTKFLSCSSQAMPGTRNLGRNVGLAVGGVKRVPHWHLFLTAEPVLCPEGQLGQDGMCQFSMPRSPYSGRANHAHQNTDEAFRGIFLSIFLLRQAVSLGLLKLLVT